MSRPLKKLWREFRYLVAPAGLKAMVALSRIVPREVAHILLVEVVGKVAWWFAGHWRQRMRENITISLGNRKSPEERDQIAKAALRNMFLGFVELLYSIHSVEEVLDGIPWEGKEILEESLKAARGVIAVTAHIGNFTLIAAAMNLQGYPFRMIVKDPKHPRMAKTFQQLRERQGTRWIPALPPMRCQREILRSLKRGEIVGFVADEGRRRGGIVMEFLGRRMAMPPGPAFYHLATHAPILPVYLLRDGKERLRMVVKPPLELSLSGNRERDLYLITRAVTRELEGTIRSYPHQWHWVSRVHPKIRTRRRAPKEMSFAEG